MSGRIVPIGNSQGIRIPKPLLEQAEISGDVELDVDGSSNVIRPARRPRSGWSEAFAETARREDDRPSNEPEPRWQWDRTEWK